TQVWLCDLGSAERGNIPRAGSVVGRPVGVCVEIGAGVAPNPLCIDWRRLRRRRGVLTHRAFRNADDQDSGQNEYARRARDHFDVVCCDCAACARLLMFGGVEFVRWCAAVRNANAINTTVTSTSIASICLCALLE